MNSVQIRLLQDARNHLCYLCKFWEAVADREPGTIGECRRHAPMPKLIQGGPLTEGWPENAVELVRWPHTAAGMSCGEFKEVAAVGGWIHEAVETIEGS